MTELSEEGLLHLLLEAGVRLDMAFALAEDERAAKRFVETRDKIWKEIASGRRATEASAALNDLACLGQEMGEFDPPGVEAYRKCINDQSAEIERYRTALQRLADCDWVITLPDRMDAVRKIARDALGGYR